MFCCCSWWGCCCFCWPAGLASDRFICRLTSCCATPPTHLRLSISLALQFVWWGLKKKTASGSLILYSDSGSGVVGLAGWLRECNFVVATSCHSPNCLTHTAPPPSLTPFCRLSGQLQAKYVAVAILHTFLCALVYYAGDAVRPQLFVTPFSSFFFAAAHNVHPFPLARWKCNSYALLFLHI